MDFINANIEQIEDVFGLVVLIVCMAMVLAKRTWPSADIRLFSRGFFGAVLLGDAYYTIYTLVFGYNPQYFYGAELAWLAEELFLLLLIVEFYSKEGISPINPTSWIAPILIVALTTWFVGSSGELVFNILMGVAMSGIALFALSALLNSKSDREKGIVRHNGLYLAAVAFVAAEYILWSCSVLDSSVSLANPYYIVQPILYVTLFCIAVAIMHLDKLDDGGDA